MATYIEYMLENGVGDLFEDWGWQDTISNEVYNFITWADANPQHADRVFQILDGVMKGVSLQVLYSDFKGVFDEYDREASTISNPDSIPRSLPRGKKSQDPVPRDNDVSEDFKTPRREKKRAKAGQEDTFDPTAKTLFPDQKEKMAMNVDKVSGFAVHDSDTGYVKKQVYKPRIKPLVKALLHNKPQVSYPTPWNGFDEFTDLRLSCLDNEAAFSFFAINTRSEMESLMGKMVRTVDIVDDGKESTATEPFDFHDFNSTVLEAKSWMKLEMRNNYNYVVNVAVYHIHCTESTDRGAVALMNDGLSRLQGDKTLGTVIVANKPHYAPEDSATFLNHFYISKKEAFRLNPGQDTTSYIQKKYIFSPDAEQDILNDNVEGATCGFFVKIMGTVGHAGDNADLCGYTPAYLDTVLHKHFTFRGYGANPFVALHTYDVTDIEESNVNLQRSESGPAKATNFNGALT